MSYEDKAQVYSALNMIFDAFRFVLLILNFFTLESDKKYNTLSFFPTGQRVYIYDWTKN